MKIDELRAMKIVGNAGGDAELLDLAHQIAVDETLPTAIRYEALRKMDEAMGLDNEPVELEWQMMDEIIEYVTDAADAMDSMDDEDDEIS